MREIEMESKKTFSANTPMMREIEFKVGKNFIRVVFYGR
jgi:hypothetical protein